MRDVSFIHNNDITDNTTKQFICKINTESNQLIQHNILYTNNFINYERLRKQIKKIVYYNTHINDKSNILYTKSKINDIFWCVVQSEVEMVNDCYGNVINELQSQYTAMDNTLIINQYSNEYKLLFQLALQQCLPHLCTTSNCNYISESSADELLQSDAQQSIYHKFTNIIEFSKQLEYLRQYIILNYVILLKVLNKYESVTEPKSTDEYLHQLSHEPFYQADQLLQLINRTEEIVKQYIDNNVNNNNNTRNNNSLQLDSILNRLTGLSMSSSSAIDIIHQQHKLDSNNTITDDNTSVSVSDNDNQSIHSAQSSQALKCESDSTSEYTTTRAINRPHELDTNCVNHDMTSSNNNSDCDTPASPGVIPAQVSCHQCKIKRDIINMLHCTTIPIKRDPLKIKRKPAQCRKKYCSQCLERIYMIHVNTMTLYDKQHWTCPSCQLTCTCAACMRRVYAPSIVTDFKNIKRAQKRINQQHNSIINNDSINSNDISASPYVLYQQPSNQQHQSSQSATQLPLQPFMQYSMPQPQYTRIPVQSLTTQAVVVSDDLIRLQMLQQRFGLLQFIQPNNNTNNHTSTNMSTIDQMVQQHQSTGWDSPLNRPSSPLSTISSMPDSPSLTPQSGNSPIPHMKRVASNPLTGLNEPLQRKLSSGSTGRNNTNNTTQTNRPRLTVSKSIASTSPKYKTAPSMFNSNNNNTTVLPQQSQSHSLPTTQYQQLHNSLSSIPPNQLFRGNPPDAFSTMLIPQQQSNVPAHESYINNKPVYQSNTLSDNTTAPINPYSKESIAHAIRLVEYAKANNLSISELEPIAAAEGVDISVFVDLLEQCQSSGPNYMNTTNNNNNNCIPQTSPSPSSTTSTQSSKQQLFASLSGQNSNLISPSHSSSNNIELDSFQSHNQFIQPQQQSITHPQPEHTYNSSYLHQQQKIIQSLTELQHNKSMTQSEIDAHTKLLLQKLEYLQYTINQHEQVMTN